MKRFGVLFSVLALCAMLTGCYLSPVIPPTGALYSDLKAPQTPAAKGALGTKSGRAEAYSILGLIGLGDCSVSAAANDGGVTTVNHTDYEFFNVLGVYQKYTTIVYGD